jgi:hypothetical protein
MGKRDKSRQRLALLAIAAIAGRITHDEVTEFGRLYIESGTGGGKQAAEKDRRIEKQRIRIGQLERQVGELERRLAAAGVA